MQVFKLGNDHPVRIVNSTAQDALPFHWQFGSDYDAVAFPWAAAASDTSVTSLEQILTQKGVAAEAKFANDDDIGLVSRDYVNDPRQSASAAMSDIPRKDSDTLWLARTPGILHSDVITDTSFRFKWPAGGSF